MQEKEVENPYIKKAEDGRLVVTDEGEQLLRKILTDTKGPVYAFTSEAPQLLVAAAMARLSRRGDDLRKIYLDEFAAVGESEAEALMDRVVTAYGDDSVQQLANLSFVVEDASNLLTKQLEWGRLMAYLEQSTRYIYYDQKDADGAYKYFTPKLSDDLAGVYRQTMDDIFILYSEVVRGVTDCVRAKHPKPEDPRERTAWFGATRAQACDAARPMLPVATKSTVGIVGSAQAVESLVRHLLANPLQEAQETGRRLLMEARKVIGAFLKRADIPERGLAWAVYMRDTKENLRSLARQHLKPSGETTFPEVALLNFWPANELELVPEILFEGATLSLGEIAQQVATWPEEKKNEVLHAYIGARRNRRHKPGRAFEMAHYEFEVTADYGTFRDLQRHRMVDGWEWQDLTPRYGYEVPTLITEAGFEEKFRESFNVAEGLYKTLIRANLEAEAQYATLLGHRMRYRFMINAREAFHLLELRTSPQGHPGYRRICQEMHRLLAAKHPLLGAAMTFVNKDGDPQLTRLEAERATQMKLQVLETSTPD